jgi:hypothetical protein
MDRLDHIKLPATSVLMVSPRDYRLATLSGWCQLFTANVPTKVPPHAYKDALRAGITAATEAQVAEASKEPEPEPEPTLDPDERAAQLDAAILKVMTRNDPADFKKDLTPKATKVVAELPPEFDPRPTATEVLDAFSRLQENFDLAED